MRPKGFKNPHGVVSFGMGDEPDGECQVSFDTSYIFEEGADEYERCLKGMSECLLGADLSKAVQIYLKVVNKRGYWVFIEEGTLTSKSSKKT